MTCFFGCLYFDVAHPDDMLHVPVYLDCLCFDIAHPDDMLHVSVYLDCLCFDVVHPDDMLHVYVYLDCLCLILPIPVTYCVSLCILTVFALTFHILMTVRVPWEQATSRDMVNCTICPVGAFCPGMLQGFTLCPPAWTTLSFGASSLLQCSECRSMCPDGEYCRLPSSVTDNKPCAGCPKGHFCPPGAKQPTECLPGSYADKLNSTACTLCRVGSASPWPVRSDACDLCSPGYYAEVEGRTSCSVCGIGKFQPNAGSTGCQACDMGKYQPLGASTACLSCPLGFGATNKSAVSVAEACELCRAGKYSFFQSPEISTCNDCPIGTYSQEDGQYRCFSCPPHTITLSKGSTSSSQCICNDRTAIVSPETQICTPCLSGCDKGYYISSEGCKQGLTNSVCTACASCGYATFLNPDYVCNGNTIVDTQSVVDVDVQSKVCIRCRPECAFGQVMVHACLSSVSGTVDTVRCVDDYQSVDRHQCDDGQFFNSFSRPVTNAASDMQMLPDATSRYFAWVQSHEKVEVFESRSVLYPSMPSNAYKYD